MRKVRVRNSPGAGPFSCVVSREVPSYNSDAVSGLGQRQRGREPDDARANNANITNGRVVHG